MTVSSRNSRQHERSFKGYLHGGYHFTQLDHFCNVTTHYLKLILKKKMLVSSAAGSSDDS